MIAGQQAAPTVAGMLQRAETAATLAGVRASRTFFERSFLDGAPEALLVAHVDEGARCIHLARYEGESADESVPVRQIISDAARLGSAGVVLARNRTGSDAPPSATDHAATRKLATAAEAVDVSLLDHLFFTGEQCTSMRQLGLL